MNSPELKGKTAGVRDDSIVEITVKVDTRHQVTIEVSRRGKLFLSANHNFQAPSTSEPVTSNGQIYHREKYWLRGKKAIKQKGVYVYADVVGR